MVHYWVFIGSIHIDHVYNHRPYIESPPYKATLITWWYGMVWYGMAEVCEGAPVAVSGWVLTIRLTLIEGLMMTKATSSICR